MRIAYLDCFAGVAGDMFLGALIDAGVPVRVLEEATVALDIGASLRIERVDRSGITATKVHVMEGDHLADEPGGLPQQQAHTHTHSHQPKTQHLHKTGHPHTHEHVVTHDHVETHEDEHSHEHAHVHGRSLTEIRKLIQASTLEAPVKAFAVRAFELLGASEAKIHNVPVDQIHFHEVGAVDAIVDIVAASAGIHHLQIGAWYSSSINVGSGMVQCAHGNFPVPAPATADLLRGVPTYSAHVEKELTTPTGAALVRALNPTFGSQPAMRVAAIGYGAGTRNPAGFANVLRLAVGDAVDAGPAPGDEAQSEAVAAGSTVTVLETALDDLSPQVTAYVTEQALAHGALDVMLTPVIMKKGRPGTLLTVLCDPAQSSTLEELLLRETSTLGLRIRQDRRRCLERVHVSVDTSFGPVRMKIGRLNGEEMNAAPEFEDCRAAASQHGVALKLVQQAAIAAYKAR